MTRFAVVQESCRTAELQSCRWWRSGTGAVAGLTRWDTVKLCLTVMAPGRYKQCTRRMRDPPPHRWWRIGLLTTNLLNISKINPGFISNIQETGILIFYCRCWKKYILKNRCKSMWTFSIICAGLWVVRLARQARHRQTVHSALHLPRPRHL